MIYCRRDLFSCSFLWRRALQQPSCYLTSHVSSKTRFALEWFHNRWSNRTAAKENASPFPRNWLFFPLRLVLFCMDQDTKAKACLIPTKLNSVLYPVRCCSSIFKLRAVGFEKRRRAPLLFSSCPYRGCVWGAGVFHLSVWDMLHASPI